MGGEVTGVTFYRGNTRVECDTGEFCDLGVGAEPPVVVVREFPFFCLQKPGTTTVDFRVGLNRGARSHAPY